MERVGVPRSLIQTLQASSGSSFTFFVQLYTLSLILGFATEIVIESKMKEWLESIECTAEGDA